MTKMTGEKPNPSEVPQAEEAIVLHLDEVTTNELLQTNGIINELNAKVNLICSTFARANGYSTTDFKLTLNQECSEILVEKINP